MKADHKLFRLPQILLRVPQIGSFKAILSDTKFYIFVRGIQNIKKSKKTRIVADSAANLFSPAAESTYNL